MPDGSFHLLYKIRTAGFVFDDGFCNVIGLGGCRVLGPSECHCSYRSELYGIYLVMFIYFRDYATSFRYRKEGYVLVVIILVLLIKDLALNFSEYTTQALWHYMGAS